MADWFYADGDERRGPFDGHELRERFARGELPPTTLVWNDSLPDWQAASTLPFLVPPKGAAPPPLETSGGYAEHYAPIGAAAYGYAGFWKRFAAYFLDSIIVSIATLPIFIVLGVMMFAGGQSLEAAGGLNIIMNLLSVFIAWLYYALFECSRFQGTPGKMALGIQVTDLDGRRIGFGRATGRYWAKLVSAIALMIGFIMAGFTEKKQGLHDMMAGTLVVNKR